MKLWSVKLIFLRGGGHSRNYKWTPSVSSLKSWLCPTTSCNYKCFIISFHPKVLFLMHYFVTNHNEILHADGYLFVHKLVFLLQHGTFAMSTLVRFHLPLALSSFHTAFVKGMPFSACHGRMPQPVLTCASVVVQLVTSVDGEFDEGI